jgi:IS30 family transposase
MRTEKGIDKVARKINAMPMKCLGYKTSAEVFAECVGIALVG